MIKKENFFLTHSRDMEKKYAGKYIAVVDDKVVAVGCNRLDVYNKATKHIPKDKRVGVFYLPLKDEVLTAL